MQPAYMSMAGHALAVARITQALGLANLVGTEGTTKKQMVVE